ncbi:putative secreted protein [Planomonospora sphaerica]|uniref:Putative secreted protein n=1 Tax=Planomonospora sphaerica TaxID=161355 RepID=A0A161MCU5_9ACTN|nr:hypothetical protein [Planomonospora sphaerica]GAT69153.1 putative secreted protein [Planomonospora sphaerica]
MSDSAYRLSRRRLLTVGAGIVGAAALGRAADPSAAAAVPEPVDWRHDVTENGWPVVGAVGVHRVEGSNVSVPVLAGSVAVVLLHVARRFHYEIDALRSDAPDEITGHVTSRAVAQPYESNYLSGTAIAIRPGGYPVGVSGGFFPHETTVIRDILAECDGLVRWGGDDPTPKESHFQIDVRPGDRRLRLLAGRISVWNQTPGEGAGSVDPFTSERLTAARELAREQRRRARKPPA